MDKKRAVLVIVLALLLAFAVAILIKPKQAETLPALNQNDELVIETETSIAEENIEATINEDIKENTEEAIVEKEIVKSVDKPVSKSQDQTPVFERIQAQEETTKIEEAGVSFDDPGIINENGVIVVTRDFKVKSPRKYSFKDFGVLAAPPVR